MDSQTTNGLTPEERRTRRWFWFASIPVLLIVAVVAICSSQTTREKWIATTFTSAIASSPEGEIQQIGSIIRDNQSEFRNNARYWSLVYFGSVFGAALCSGLAGLLIRLEFFVTSEKLKKDLAAILATAATLLITLSTVGGFAEKWRTNRLAAARMEQIAYEFIAAQNDAPTIQQLHINIQEVARDRSEGILSPGTADPAPIPKAGPKTN